MKVALMAHHVTSLPATKISCCQQDSQASTSLNLAKLNSGPTLLGSVFFVFLRFNLLIFDLSKSIRGGIGYSSSWMEHFYLYTSW